MYFDEIALKWDTERRIERAKSLSASIYKALGQTKDMTALEIGCGTGLITFELKDKFHEIHCMDPSTEMLKILWQKIKLTETQNVYTYGREILEDKKYYEKYDAIYSSMVLHHIINIEAELLKYKKLLKKEGYLVIIDLDEEDGRFHKEEKDFCGHNGFNRMELQRTLERCNYKEVSFETVYQDFKTVYSEEISYSLFLCCARG